MVRWPLVKRTRGSGRSSSGNETFPVSGFTVISISPWIASEYGALSVTAAATGVAGAIVAAKSASRTCGSSGMVTASEQSWIAEPPWLSATRRANAAVPANSGVPVMAPPGARDSPWGSEPIALQVNGAVPPAASSRVVNSVPTRACGSGHAVATRTAGGRTRCEQLCETRCPRASVTDNANSNAPAWRGTPAARPAVETVKPGGRLPEADQKYGPTPPTAVSVCSKAWSRAPSRSGQEEMPSADGTTVRLQGAATGAPGCLRRATGTGTGPRPPACLPGGRPGPGSIRAASRRWPRTCKGRFRPRPQAGSHSQASRGLRQRARARDPDGGRIDHHPALLAGALPGGIGHSQGDRVGADGRGRAGDAALRSQTQTQRQRVADRPAIGRQSAGDGQHCV